MSRATQHTRIVDVAIGIVVDKMSPSANNAEAANNVHGTPEINNTAPRILITRRKAGQVLGGYWELPGGKVEPNESPSDTVVRELLEEVGIKVGPIDTLDPVEHRYEHAHIRLIPFICEHIGGTPQPLQVDEVRWAAPDRLADYAFPEASLPVIADLIRWLDNTTR
ncbi:MAG: (deoxy)nucleoside triphosphate pyrophosphohydrolase [Phycisphaeraceae bacterium]|nr:(deoxy)nucleoside triphosphate pyrophosphohydrolase [Phycisphaeraceae bacterium]